MMPTRAQAEDLADRVNVELEELPAVVDAVAAMRPDSPRVFDEWPNNAYISISVVEGNPEIAGIRANPAAPPVANEPTSDGFARGTRACSPTGTIGWTSLSSICRRKAARSSDMALSRMLGLPEEKVRVIAPDVGGGFGGKNRIMPEDVAVAAIALKVGHPVRWIEDRREHLLASVHARDHTYDLVISADRDGTLLGIEGDILYRCRSLCACGRPAPFKKPAWRLAT